MYKGSLGKFRVTQTKLSLDLKETPLRSGRENLYFLVTNILSVSKLTL